LSRTSVSVINLDDSLRAVSRNRNFQLPIPIPCLALGPPFSRFSRHFRLFELVGVKVRILTAANSNLDFEQAGTEPRERDRDSDDD
jgi:hypothetical protein